MTFQLALRWQANFYLVGTYLLVADIQHGFLPPYYTYILE